MDLAFLIVGMAIVTFAIRYSMIAVLGRWDIPPVLRGTLRYVPIAAFAAIIVPALFTQTDGVATGFDNARLIAGVIATLVAVFTRQIALTFIAGMSVMWLVQAIGIR
jgi:branched-subunit amino acid transport protein